MKLLVEHDLRHAFNEDRGAYGDHEKGNRRRVAGRLDGEPVQQQPDHHRRDDGDESREGQRDAGGDEEHGAHPADHDEVALGEVDDVGGVVDEGEAQRHEGVDGPDRQAGKHQLQEFGHGMSSRGGRSGEDVNARRRPTHRP